MIRLRYLDSAVVRCYTPFVYTLFILLIDYRSRIPRSHYGPTRSFTLGVRYHAVCDFTGLRTLLRLRYAFALIPTFTPAPPLHLHTPPRLHAFTHRCSTCAVRYRTPPRVTHVFTPPHARLPHTASHTWTLRFWIHRSGGPATYIVPSFRLAYTLVFLPLHTHLPPTGCYHTPRYTSATYHRVETCRTTCVRSFSRCAHVYTCRHLHRCLPRCYHTGSLYLRLRFRSVHLRSITLRYDLLYTFFGPTLRFVPVILGHRLRLDSPAFTLLNSTGYAPTLLPVTCVTAYIYLPLLVLLMPLRRYTHTFPLPVHHTV